jgi:hypothetical protein
MGLLYLDICDFILQQVVARQPDRYEACLLWGESLYLRARFNSEPETRRELITAAGDKFRQAEKCPGVDWQLYQSWGQGLAVLAYGGVGDADVGVRLMRQAVEILERGAGRKDLAEDRGRLLRSGGLVAGMLADRVVDELDRTHWYRQAVRNYDEAREHGVEIPLFHNGVLTEALYRLSDLTEDPDLARRAVERGRHGLELSPDDAGTHYNLVCAYAVLGEHGLAVKHLETAVTGDARYFSRAKDDPVLEGFRASGEYAAFLEFRSGQPATPAPEDQTTSQ